MVKTHIIALLLLLVTACGGSVDGPTPAPATNWEPYPACSCGWDDNPETQTESCSAPFALTSSDTLETLDDGASVCHIYDESCTAPGRADCAATCKRTHVTCQPAKPLGQP